MDKIMEFLATQGIEWQGTSQLMESLGAMAQGMLGIFIVIGIIILAVYLLAKIGKSGDNK